MTGVISSAFNPFAFNQMSVPSARRTFLNGGRERWRLFVSVPIPPITFFLSVFHSKKPDVSTAARAHVIHDDVTVRIFLEPYGVRWKVRAILEIPEPFARAFIQQSNIQHYRQIHAWFYSFIESSNPLTAGFSDGPPSSSSSGAGSGAGLSFSSVASSAPSALTTR